MKRLSLTLLTVVACLLPLRASADTAPSMANVCDGGGDAPVCGTGSGHGWYMERTGTTQYDMHYLVNGVSWYDFSPSGTTLTIDSEQGTSVVHSDATTFSSTVAVTGALTLSSTLDMSSNLVTAGPWFSSTFAEGASKGVALYTPLSAAYSTTADAVNVLAYGETFRGHFVTNTTAAGTVTPAGTAIGLNLNGGSPGAADEWTFTTGMGDASGGQIIVGTTAAWTACANIDITDVSAVDAVFLEVTTVGAHVDLSSADPNYGSYAAIGAVAGDIYVSDQTTGGTDTTDNWTDGQDKTLCILGDGAGVITYTIDGSAPASTDAHTLGDGVPHVVRIQALNDGAAQDDIDLISFSLLPQ